jgi:transposase
LHGSLARRTAIKIHALVDAEGLSIALKLTEGQAHTGRSACDMLDALVEGQNLLAYRAYDSDALRQSLATRGAFAKTARICRLSALTSTDIEILSSASLTKSSITAPSPRATTNDRKTSSRRSLSLRIWIRFNESVT